MFKKNILLIAAAVIIIVAPLATIKGAEFLGSDGQAKDAVTQIDPSYVPWFESIVELPSGEMETLLFCVQAAIGAGVMGFILGRMTAKPKKGEENAPD